MSEARTLAPNPIVESLHQSGVAMLKHDHRAAETKLVEADALRATFYGANPEQGAVHGARIERDLGQNALRKALRLRTLKPTRELAVFIEASDTAFTSSEETLRKIADAPKTYSKADQAYLFAEWAASTSWRGRQLIAVKALGFSERLLADEAMNHFKRAHTLHRKGSNRYYDTSNSMHAARLEAYQGNFRETGRWMGRAALSVCKHLATNRHTAGGSLRTFLRLGRDIVTRRHDLEDIILAGGV